MADCRARLVHVLHELRGSEGGLRPFQLIERTLFAQYKISGSWRGSKPTACREACRCDEGRGQTSAFRPRARNAPRMWAIYGRSIAELVGPNSRPTS